MLIKSMFLPSLSIIMPMGLCCKLMHVLCWFQNESCLCFYSLDHILSSMLEFIAFMSILLSPFNELNSKYEWNMSDLTFMICATICLIIVFSSTTSVSNYSLTLVWWWCIIVFLGLNFFFKELIDGLLKKFNLIL